MKQRGRVHGSRERVGKLYASKHSESIQRSRVMIQGRGYGLRESGSNFSGNPQSGGLQDFLREATG